MSDTESPRRGDQEVSVEILTGLTGLRLNDEHKRAAAVDAVRKAAEEMMSMTLKGGKQALSEKEVALRRDQEQTAELVDILNGITLARDDDSAELQRKRADQQRRLEFINMPNQPPQPKEPQIYSAIRSVLSGVAAPLSKNVKLLRLPDNATPGEVLVACVVYYWKGYLLTATINPAVPRAAFMATASKKILQHTSVENLALLEKAVAADYSCVPNTAEFYTFWQMALAKLHSAASSATSPASPAAASPASRGNSIGIPSPSPPQPLMQFSTEDKRYVPGAAAARAAAAAARSTRLHAAAAESAANAAAMAALPPLRLPANGVVCSPALSALHGDPHVTLDDLRRHLNVFPTTSKEEVLLRCLGVAWADLSQRVEVMCTLNPDHPRWRFITTLTENLAQDIPANILAQIQQVIKQHPTIVPDTPEFRNFWAAAERKLKQAEYQPFKMQTGDNDVADN